MARAQLEAGVSKVVATPHVSRTFPNRSSEIRERLGELSDALDRESLALTVEMGAEVSASAAMQLDDQELASLRLGDSRWLLIEPPSSVDSVGILSMVGEIQMRGHRVLIAHPERVDAFRRDPGVLESIIRGGARTQVTASALNGRFGQSAKHFAEELLAADLVNVVSSDSHDTVGRPPGLLSELEKAGKEEMVQALCVDGPAAMLDDC